MSKEIQRIPDAELEIMNIIWEAEESVNSDYIMERLHKDWARPTLLNLLNRLYDRGFVDFYKQGKFKMYSPLIRKEDYLKKESNSFFKKMRYKSVTSLVASLYDGGSIDSDELDELEKFIKEVR